ncbi:hypothetical protein HCA15_14020 [Listeria booriae]|uniref:hypothetical protein n=1 Tax=Listeria booriae TaxID=1552123 RepID=UPI00162475F4|nr:hypothetical protein [Listeria booriae]MBC1945105.1 hypothetical protein [Listeria booriae]MBC6167765.1 hypothetical protein [Listeria booriae]
MEKFNKDFREFCLNRVEQTLNEDQLNDPFVDLRKRQMDIVEKLEAFENKDFQKHLDELFICEVEARVLIYMKGFQEGSYFIGGR